MCLTSLGTPWEKRIRPKFGVEATPTIRLSARQTEEKVGEKGRKKAKKKREKEY